jgi:hypothetical protein
VSRIKQVIASVALVVVSAVLGQLVGCSTTGCASALQSIEEIDNPSDNAALSKCRADARAEKYISGDVEKAWRIYVDCKHEAGLK